MILRGTEHQSLFALVYLLHKQFHPIRLALLDLDDLIEVRFRITLAGLDLALYHLVVRGINIIVQRGLNLPYLERREETVVDSVLERVNIYGLAKVTVRIGVFGALWRGGE